MTTPAGIALLDHFAALRDPRQHAKVLYPLPEILLLVLSATLAGADDFVETTLWGTQHLAFLRRFYRYQSGIPSHDTLCDVFAALDPELFKACFQAWVSGLRDADADIIAIDGKTSRRSHDTRYYLCSLALCALSFARVVRAHWGVENRLHWVLDVVFREDLARFRTGEQPMGDIADPHFAELMLATFIGAVPPTPRLKRELLGMRD